MYVLNLYTSERYNFVYFNGSGLRAWDIQHTKISDGINWTDGGTSEKDNGNTVDDPDFWAIPPVYQGGWVDIPVSTFRTIPYGRNVTGINTNNVKSSPLRDKSSRYMIYLAKGDSFKVAEAGLIDYIKANNITVMASCDPQYYDKRSGLISQQITLNQLVSANPQGKKYGLNSLETILSEINQQNKIKFSPDGGLYLILGEDTATYHISYTDNEKDPLIHAYYHTAHDPNYFTNGTGLSTYNNTDLVWPPTSFDKVGKYKLDYYVIDNPTLGSDSEIFGNYRKKSKPASIDVYVHRRPIANFDLSYNYQSTYIGISPISYAYDLDHIGAYWNGITKVEYKYRLNGEPSWHDGIPWGLNYSDTIEVAQTVTDLEGATNSIVKTFIMPTEMPLVLTCELKTERPEFSKKAIPASESLRLTNIIVNRALPHGIEIDLKSNDGLINQKYTEYTNSNTGTYTDANGKRQWHDILIRLPETYKDGGYKVEVKLKDIKNTNGTSYQVKTGDQDRKSLDFNIITPVNINASIAVQSGNSYDLKGITGGYSKETIVKLFSGTSYEKTFSLQKISETHKSNHLLDQATWTRNVKIIAVDANTSAPAPTGQYIARFETKTASGNQAISEVPFDYRPVTVKSFDVRGYWNHWRGQTTLKGEVTTVEPHRFLAHECVIFEALIHGEIEGALLRLSPELESMTYWDKYNNLYRYEDDFHMKVYFPVHLKKVKSTAEGDLWQYEYALPYADSTQSFENERLKPSYKATLYVIPKGVDWHGDYTTKGLIQQEIANIDITGNIHDLLYIEPVRGSQ